MFIRSRGLELCAAICLSICPLLMAQTAPSDDCLSATAIVSMPFASTSDTTAATSDPADPLQSCTPSTGANSRSVWYSFTPACNGTLSIQTCDSSYDTVLTVYTGICGNLTEIACNDDACGYQSQVLVHVVADIPVLIEVTAYGSGGGGTLQFAADMECCTLPDAPADPMSWESGTGSVTLTWGNTVTKKEDQPTPSVIYGPDDRLDQFEVYNPAWQAAGDATVVLLSRSSLIDNGNGTMTILAGTFGTDNNLCESERFYYQPDPGFCSGFLVAPDIIATAGHCVDSSSYVDVAFVFGFVMLEPYTAVTTVEASEIYYATEVIARQEVGNGADYALVRLDRPVANHTPLTLQRSGQVADSQELLVIGHPSGLPRKYSGNAQVRDNSPSAYFVANLDTYGGNSGSAVLNAATMEVEGILVRGETDFVLQGSCYVSNVCPDDGCGGEEVTRSSEFASLVPFLVYDVYFGTCDSPLQPIYTGLNSRSCTYGPLLPETEYCWQVAARSECGAVLGPVWSFTTMPPLPPTMLRAVSRLTHGTAGTYDVEVLMPGSIEGRAGGPRTLICTFDKPIQQVAGTTEDVTLSSGTVNELSLEGNILTVQMSGANDREYLIVSFPGIADSVGATVVQTLCIGVLTGDVRQFSSTTPDRAVNIYDIIAVKEALDRAPNSTTFRADVDQAIGSGPDGMVNIYDLIAVKRNLDHALPEFCPWE